MSGTDDLPPRPTIWDRVFRPWRAWRYDMAKLRDDMAVYRAVRDRNRTERDTRRKSGFGLGCALNALMVGIPVIIICVIVIEATVRSLFG